MKFQPILEAAVRAPSGDNCQPWRFDVDESRIDLFNLPERDVSLYNHKQRASLIAHGACIENMMIAASKFGYKANLEYFPSSTDENHVARIELSEVDGSDDPYFAAISARTINRKLYRGGELTTILTESIRDVAANSGVEGCSLHLLQGEKKNLAADIVALSDRLVFENRYLHGFLFDHIRWSHEEAERTRDGLDIRTLELAPPDRVLFPLLNNFVFVKFLKLFGVTRIIAANARKLMLSASAAGIITIENASPQMWLNAGRLLERVWLETTRLGLAFHLMTGITLMVQRVREGAVEGLDDDNIALIKHADSILSGVVGADQPVALLFRIGHADPPKARSLRLPAT